MLKNLFYVFLLLTSFTATAQDVIYGVSSFGGSEGNGSIWKVNEDGSEFEVLESYSGKNWGNSKQILTREPIYSENGEEMFFVTLRKNREFYLEAINLKTNTSSIVAKIESDTLRIKVAKATKNIVLLSTNDEVLLINRRDSTLRRIHRLQQKEDVYGVNKKYIQIINEEIIVLDQNKFYRYSETGVSLGIFYEYRDGKETLYNQFVADKNNIYCLTESGNKLIRFPLNTPQNYKETDISKHANTLKGTYQLLIVGESEIVISSYSSSKIIVLSKQTNEVNIIPNSFPVFGLYGFYKGRLRFNTPSSIVSMSVSGNYSQSKYTYTKKNIWPNFFISVIDDKFIYGTLDKVAVVDMQSNLTNFRYLINKYSSSAPSEILASNNTHLLYRREKGGEFDEGDFVLWDIEKKESETFLLAGDTTYIKKVFQVSDKLFKVLEQQPFEVATVRDSVLNKEPKKFDTFGRSDLKIYEGKNVLFYVATGTYTYVNSSGTSIAVEDSVYIASEGKLKFVGNVPMFSNYTTFEAKLFALNRSSEIRYSDGNHNIELYEIGTQGVEKNNIAVNGDSFRGVEVLFYNNNNFFLIDSLLYLPAFTFNNDGTFHSVLGLNPKTKRGKVITSGNLLRYINSSNKIFTSIDNDFYNPADTAFAFKFRSYNTLTDEVKNYEQSLPQFMTISDVVSFKTSATLQLKPPDKSIDFTKPVSFDNRSGENEQLSFYLKNEGVGRSLNVSTRQLYISGKDSASFKLNLPENLTLKPNDSVKVQLDFVPVSKGIKEAKLIFNPSIKNARTTSATADNSLEIVLAGTAKDKQSILLDLPSEVSFATTQSITLPKTASSGLPITYSISNPNIASIENYVLTIKNGGETSITANQTGNTDFWSADSVTHTLNVLLPLSVEPISENKAYPNPATSWVKIPLESKIYQQETIKVSDINGRIFNLKIEIQKSELKVDISSLSAGKYFIKLLNSNYVFVKQ
jgi:hypothetical protein